MNDKRKIELGKFIVHDVSGFKYEDEPSDLFYTTHADLVLNKISELEPCQTVESCSCGGYFDDMDNAVPKELYNEFIESFKNRKPAPLTKCSCGGELVDTKVCGVCAHSYCVACLEEDFDICQGCLSKGMKLNFCEDKNGKKFYPGKWLKSEHSNTWVQVLQIGKHCIVSTAGNVNRDDFVDAGWVVHERLTGYELKGRTLECLTKCKFGMSYIGSAACRVCQSNKSFDTDQKWVICKLYNEDKKDDFCK